MKITLGACVLCCALSAGAAAQTPAGPELRVNTYTTGRQDRASLAMQPDGDFVVVWTSYGQDGPSFGVMGQRYAASGAPRGGEFLVNEYTTGAQFQPAVAVGSGGDFVVAWASVPGASAEIQGRRFDAAGSAIGGEFQVNAFTTGYQKQPRVGRASDGRFVVIWMNPEAGGNFDLAGRRFDPSGNPVGLEFLVNSYTTGTQQYGDLAVAANGSFLVVWEDSDGRDGSGYAIFGQRFDASANRVGNEFLVNSYTTGHQRHPSIGASPTGGFVVVWNSEFGDGSSYGILARRFDALGNPAGDDFVVNSYTTGFQYGRLGQVAHDARGNFVITWAGPGDGGGYGTFARRFNASGIPRGAEFQLNTYTPNAQRRPMAVSDAVGNFAMTWESDAQDGSQLGVYAQRYGGLRPAALAVDGAGNHVLEPGETVDVRPAWRNLNGAAQTFGGALTGITGPAGGVYTITDPTGDYGAVADGATAECGDCYAVSVSDPPTRPAVHWDASAVETIVPDAQGQQKGWSLHVGRSFTDVPTSGGFYRFVETLLHNGVTSGCGGTAYCPASAVTREQMSPFVLVAREGTGYVPPACATPMFGDVPASSPFCRWIEELVRRGVVAGCGGGNYCPTSAVTREQMPVFVLRTLDPSLVPPACTTPVFADVPASSPFCRWIEELVRRGVVSGCGGGNYCPAAPVTREQMGVFISITFGLTLYGP